MAQAQNENALGSYNPSYLEENFSYLSYLNEKDNDSEQSKSVKRKLKEIAEQPPPLGLRLTIPPVVEAIEGKLKQNGANEARTQCQAPANAVEKLKAEHLPMRTLRIGDYWIKARNQAELVAKFYFARRKLAWEILAENRLKYKIEVQWQNISAIRAVIPENKPGFLEIELDKVPSFFQEIVRPHKKHSAWAPCPDFTIDHCASRFRRHLVEFSPGTLDQHYVNLLKSDDRLMQLEMMAPFPCSRLRTTPTPINEQPTFDLPVVSNHQAETHQVALPSGEQTTDQQVQPHKRIRLLPPVPKFNQSTPLSQGNCPPTNEAINNDGRPC